MALMFNTADPVCGDPNFRKAVASAINKEDLAIFAMGSLANPVKDGTIWAYDAPFKNTAIKPIQQDLDQAKKYLKASSYKGQPIELSIMTSGSKLAESIQQQLDAIGIKIKINTMDAPSFQVYTSATNNKAQMMTFFCMMSQNPVDTYRANFYPSASNNKMNYNNADVTKMIDQAQSTLGDDAQKQLYYKMQETVSADLPAIPIYWMTSALVYPKGVGGIVTSASAHYDMRYLYKTA
jgi:peptide/nickel transport system substrate-binding protein